MIAVKVRGKSHPYPGARSLAADKGKMRVKGEDGAEFGFPLSIYNAYRFVEFPEGHESATIDLEVTPGIGRKVELVGPDGRPVTGASAMGLTNDPFASTVIDGRHVRGQRAAARRVAPGRNPARGPRPGRLGHRCRLRSHGPAADHQARPLRHHRGPPDR